MNSRSRRSGRRSTTPVFPAPAELVACGFVVVAFVLGGASREVALQTAVLEVLAVPMLAYAVSRLVVQRRSLDLRIPLLLTGGLVSLLLLQLIPLPFGLWEMIPGRQDAAAVLKLTGAAPSFLPLSLTPQYSWQALLWLMPPLAMFLLTLTLDRAARGSVLLTILAMVVVSLILGALQASSRAPLLNFYADGPASLPLGLMANRNHQAILFVACLPFAAYWMTGGKPGSALAGALARPLIGGGLAFLLLIGVAVTQSRAGAALTLPALAIGSAILWRGAPRNRRRTVLIAAGAAVGVALAIVGLFLLAALAGRFNLSAVEADTRFVVAPQIAKAAIAYLPLGSGVGSFDQVYRGVEKLDTMQHTFLNHAHNDYLEIWLEAGLPGLALLACFLAWTGVSVWTVWHPRKDTPRELRGELGLAMAASGAVALLLAHSVVDYPLRTLALAVLFAFACGVLAPRRETPASGSE